MREHKGKSLLTFLDSYTVIDIETTGWLPSVDSIVEVAAIRYENDILVDQFSSLVQPSSCFSSGIYIDTHTTSITGITNEMLLSAPPESEILPLFRTFIGDSILLGHNVNFDINFLYDKFDEYECPHLTNDFIDTLRISRRMYPDLPQHRLVDLVDYYNLDYTGAHRSLRDCQLTQSCYQKMKIEYDTSGMTFVSPKRSPRRCSKISDIIPTIECSNPDNPFYKKVCVFTGTLEKMARKEAMQTIVNLGGINSTSVTRKTNYLILGDSNYCSTIKDGKSSKMKKAEELKLNGYDIEIIPESVFYDMISEVLNYDI